ncbi:unnamed protein product [Brassicogethes aeneus]|uniref:Uncharacterized protein n=1 Tax=Brassicogethes aeneus TaxID=1431903 RepID=A0A9P0AUT2_BRAAE|nr:unnamed protein product [Brassicogethes aeneus]
MLKIRKKNVEDLQLLGFKNSIAVFGESIMSLKKVNLEVGENGSKFITINGKKMKVLIKAKFNDLTNVNKTPSKQTNSNDNKDNVTDKSTLVKKPTCSVVTVEKIGKIFKPNFLNLATNMKKETKNVKNSSCQTNTKTFKDSSCQTDKDKEDCFIDFFNLDNNIFSELDELPGIDTGIDTFLKVEMPVKKCTPAQNPVSNKNDPKVKFFFDIRNALNFNSNGNLPIHEAVLENNLNNVKRYTLVLKSLGPYINLLNQNKYTPLQVAILSEASKEIVTFLLAHGADVSLTDQEGNTVFHLAVQMNNFNALEELCKPNVDNPIIDQFNYEGLTPLMICCINQNLNCAEILLDCGAKPDILDQKSGRTALFHAAENQHLEMVKLLLDNNANTKIKNFFGTSPHDAMFEMDEIPQEIRNLIWLSKKRKASKSAKSEDIAIYGKKLKIVKTYQKINTAS